NAGGGGRHGGHFHLRSADHQDLREPDRLAMADPARQPVLKFDHVTVSFDEEVALSDMSFETYEGESRVILGAAGSDKSVLLKAALGLVKPDSGKVYAFGKDLTTMREHDLFEIRSKMGMLFQESALFDSLNIEENVA